jgi:hypothetical protein
MHHAGTSPGGFTSSLAAEVSSAAAHAASSTTSVAHAGGDTQLDLDVTVLAFAQWVSEMKSRQASSHHQMQAEMSIIRNAITSNNMEMGDFKRHSAAIQQQMQSEINEIRESLGTVFLEITTAVRNNASADQDTRLKIMGLNEQAVRNETAFAQLADAADQSQSKLKNAVQEMQNSSERMREELVGLTRFNDSMETSLTDRYQRISGDMDQVGNDLHSQLERRKDHLKKMCNDVMLIGESLRNLVSDFGEQKRTTFEVQNKLQSNLYVLDQILRPAEEPVRGRPPRVASEGFPQMQAGRALTPVRAQDGVLPAGTTSFAPSAMYAGSMAGALPLGAALSAGMRPTQTVVYR